VSAQPQVDSDRTTPSDDAHRGPADLASIFDANLGAPAVGVDNGVAVALPVPNLTERAARPLRTYARVAGARLTADVAALVAAVAIDRLVAPAQVGSTPLAVELAFILLVLLLLKLRGAYRSRLRADVLEDVRVVVTTTALAAMIVLSLRVVMGDTPNIAGQMLRQWLLATACVAGARIVLGWSDARARNRGQIASPTLIVGAGKIGALVATRLLKHPRFGLRPVGFLDDAPLDAASVPGVPVLGGIDALDHAIEQYGVEHVIVSFAPVSHESLLHVMGRCEELGMSLSFVPRLFERTNERIRVECVGSLPLVTVPRTNPRGWHFTIKYALDRAIAALLLIVLSPVLAAIAAGVWASSGRPILYRQRRVGRDGRIFEMLKFRTMNGGPSEPTNPGNLPPDTAPGGVEGADRRTGLGVILRKTSADELPQLINVLRGEMSLVGPRPERPEFVAAFERDVHRYAERHRVKAGITGWAQIHGLRGRTSLGDRVDWDNYYIDNWSFWLDFKILAHTVVALARSAV
jgi:exopolysaccharide biosynthesis polyprenyl glycosylphosphotransferase